MRVDGKLYYNTKEYFPNFKKDKDFIPCGHIKQAVSRTKTVTIPHTGSSVTLRFSATIN